MTDNYRRERIERLLKELEYEVTRGMMDGEIDETLCFRFYVPVSKALPEGVVECRFETRPTLRYSMNMGDLQPQLRVVEP